MRHNQNQDWVADDWSHSLPVRFEFTDSVAESVYLAGTFNNWQRDAKRMHPVGNNRWVREIMLPLGVHEYCFVVDGEFRPDPLAPETVPNPFGGQNSLLKVMNEPVRYATAEELWNESRNGHGEPLRQMRDEMETLAEDTNATMTAAAIGKDQR
jgi:1,4-alpha-glucan branching enzyme